MSLATSKMILFKPPYLAPNKTLLPAQKNANIEYIVSLIASASDLVLFSDLTDPDPANLYGNAYYMGYPDASHASLCIYYPRRSTGDNENSIAIDFVNDLNEPLSRYTKYAREGTDEVGYICKDGTYNRDEYWTLMITKSSDACYIQFFGANQSTSINNAINGALDEIKNMSYDVKTPSMWFSKTKSYYFKRLRNGIHFWETPINKGRISSDWDMVIQEQGIGSVASLLDREKRYYATKQYLWTRSNWYDAGIFELGAPFKRLLATDMGRAFPYNASSIIKIDNEYHLILHKYADYSFVVWDIGDEYTQDTEILA